MSQRRSLREIGISTKVVVAGLSITAMFTLTTFLWVLPEAGDALLEKKKTALREETEIAWSVLSHHARLAKRGELTVDEAQRAAAGIIEGLRWGKDQSGYFWINDTHPNMVMHPYRPDLVGKDISDFRDPNGVKLFEEMVTITEQAGAGYVRYSWQWKDEKANIVPKISYVQLFRPWNWIVGTGVYLEDIRAELMTWRVRIIFVYTLLTLTAVFLSWLVGSRVSRFAKQVRVRAGRSRAAAEPVGRRQIRGIRLRTFVLFVTVPTIVVLTGVWCVLFYQNLRGMIIEGFDNKLYAISSITGAFIDGEDHRAIAEKRVSENSETYKQYVRPMRRIAETTNLTYLYSQVILEKKPFCMYVLDATEGDDHTSVGFEDELPEDDYRGGKSVEQFGVVHIGKIQQTENWGLLKVSYAPIYNDDGSVSAMAGADVNITKIDEQTKSGLFTICLAAIAILLLAGYVSLVFSRKLTEPLSTLKDGALKLSSGRYEQEIQIDRPTDLKRLAGSFNKIGRTLRDQIYRTERENEEIESSKTRHELVVTLDRATTRDECGSSILQAEFVGMLNPGKSSSGWFCDEHHAVVWIISQPPSDALAAVRLRSDVRTICQHLLTEASGRAAELAELLESRLPPSVDALALQQRATGACVIRARRRIDINIIAPGASPERRGVEATATHAIAPGVTLLLTDQLDAVDPEIVEAAHRMSASEGSEGELIPRIARALELSGVDRPLLIAALRNSPERPTSPGAKRGGVA